MQFFKRKPDPTAAGATVPPETTSAEPKAAHGGKREGAGRPPESAKECKELADGCISWIERAAVRSGGDMWKMEKDERAKFTKNLGVIFTRWGMRGFESPYTALTMTAILYTCGSPEKVESVARGFDKVREVFKRRRREPEPNATAEPSSDESPSS